MMTVSRALNNTGYVSKKTRAKVLAAARELGYVANLSARSLAGGRTNTLGLVLTNLRTPIFAEFAHGVDEAVQKLGMDLLLYTTSADPERERARVKSLSSGLCDGLLIVLPRASESFLASLEASRVPVVLLNHRGAETPLPSVGADNYHGARAATEHLLELGHRRIGFITGTAHSGQSAQRLRAYRDALAAAGVPFEAALVQPGNFSQASGLEAARALLALKDPPTAIFAANDEMAFGALDAVKDRGLRVPDDVSVLGFDDIPMASQVYPALTTVRHPFRDLAEAAVRLLHGLIEGKGGLKTRLELPSELVVRASTGPVRHPVGAPAGRSDP